MPVPLPPAKDAGLDDMPNTLSAYKVCLGVEQRATTEEDCMHARILGYLILHSPSSTMLAEINTAIHSCAQDDKKLLELGEHYQLYFICPFKKFAGWTPAPSGHSSHPSFDRVQEDVRAKINETPKNYSEAKFQALIRDGYKCPVTGKYDAIAETNSLVDMDVIQATGSPLVFTDLAHILPQSTYFDVSAIRAPSKKEYSASVLAVLQCFGYDVEMVNGSKMHSLYNVITMEKNVHDQFDRLVLWFESMGVENCYHIRAIRESFEAYGIVRFTSPDPLTLPYPSQQLLALHAACCKVAHLSGAGEYIDRFDRDTDNLDILATDGSSSAILTHAILTSMLRPVSTIA